MPRVRIGHAMVAWLAVVAIVAFTATAATADDPPGTATTVPTPPPVDTTEAPPAPPATDPTATTPPPTTPAPAPTSAPSTTTATTTTVPSPPAETTTTAVDQAAMTVAPAPEPGCLVVGAVGVVLPSQRPRVVGLAAQAPPVRQLAQSAFAYPADGSIVAADGANLAASCGTSGSTHGKVAVRSVSLFAGYVTVDSVTLGVAGTAAPPTGSFSGLRVGGRELSLQPGRRIKLGTWGYLAAADEEAPVRRPAGAGASQVALSALSIRLVKPRAGLPAGTVVLVPFAGVELEPVEVQPAAAPQTTTTAPPTSTAQTTTVAPTTTEPAAAPPPSAERDERPAGARGAAWDPLAPHPSPFHHPLSGTPPLRAGPYVFPVAGEVAYGDSYGGVRSDVASGWHHGDDIFAALGTPVVAVADGTLNRVGWERLGGWRLWVRDRAGDEFYYAHLAGYTPLALRRGKVHVKAGEVIGFVGNTGDAITTSPHLHFEVHPTRFLRLQYDGAVDPTRYLRKWTRSGRVEPPRPVLPRLPVDPVWRAEAKLVYGELLRARGPFPVPAPVAPAPRTTKPEPLPPLAAAAVVVAAPHSGSPLPFVLGGGAAILVAAAAGAFFLRRRGTTPVPEPEPEPEG